MDFFDVCIVGSGPAGLIAADELSRTGMRVAILERTASPGRKILIAGSSGLNVASALPMDEILKTYTGSKDCWSAALLEFPPESWLSYINALGHETYTGTSPRHFLRDKKSVKFLKSWLQRLKRQEVTIVVNTTCTGLKPANDQKLGLSWHVETNRSSKSLHCRTVLLACGGASWLGHDQNVQWTEILRNHKVDLEPFGPANVGFKVDWPKKFLEEVDGKPLKNIILTTERGSRAGELTITTYGIEGTPIYAIGCTGMAYLDLCPQLTAAAVAEKLANGSRTLNPLRLATKVLRLSTVNQALLFHLVQPADRASIASIVALLKKFPLTLRGPQPLSEAISSTGGLKATHINEQFMIKNMPGVFAAGEMLDWDAPTGGFLLQCCVAQGVAAAGGIKSYIGAKHSAKQAP